ncbi:translocation/assembly module TamB domain-containing protein [Roseateles amylovorans]|uniref:Translocation/assembly module TamB domain-containing protein n=1 Tax=Roseateles amylovorans TaxID=2978473 RepID=A0ABY6B3Q7_9BURK|nr:translocation/assembly module TamB domain-containing protein [Roseateles amylovorans]UXH79564.1 translocation/assembly module TamB domain-containing protein [Roseateles amylovorans]
MNETPDHERPALTPPPTSDTAAPANGAGGPSLPPSVPPSPPSGGTDDGAAPPPRRRRRARGLLWALLAVPVLIGLLLLGLTWALKTEGGTAWVLSKVPGLTLQNAQGRLLGDFDVERAEFILPGSDDRVVLEQLQWRGVRLVWNRSPMLWGEVQADRLAVARLRVQVASSDSTEPLKPPAGLLTPVAVTVRDLEIGELHAPGLAQPLRALRGSLALGADGGEHHRLTLGSLQWQQLTLAGQAQISAREDLTLSSQWRLSQPQGELPWTAPFRLDGPLKDLSLKGQLEAARQKLLLQARLLPFASFPLAQLQAEAQALDLAALLPGTPGVPHTGLTGRILVDPTKDGALSVKADLDNTAAGRLDQDRLPLRELQLDLLLDPNHWTRLKLPRLDALLTGGGRLRAVGQTSAKDGTVLTLKLDGLDSRQIDQRWPVVQARGELRLSSTASLTQTDPDQALRVEGELAGQLGQGRLQAPLEVALAAELRPQAIELEKLHARSGPATLQATGSLTLNQALSMAEGWKADLDASIQGLDPRRLTGAAPSARAAAPATTARGAQARVGTKRVSPSAAKGGTASAAASAVLPVAGASAVAPEESVAQTFPLRTPQTPQVALPRRPAPAKAAAVPPISASGSGSASAARPASTSAPTSASASASSPPTATTPRTANATTSTDASSLPPSTAQVLNGKLQAQLQSVRGSLWPQGRANLDLQPSVWHGLPLQGQVRYARAANAVPDLQADLRLADASLQARSRIDPALKRGGEQVDLSIDLDAPKLASLQPLLRAEFPAAALQGALQAKAAVQLVQPGTRSARYSSEGRWQLSGFALAGVPGLPALTGSTAAVRTGASPAANARWPLSIDTASGDWKVSSLREAALSWTTQIKQLRAAPQNIRLEQTTLTLDGSWSQHQLKLESNGQVPLPPVLTAPTQTKVVARAQAASSSVASRLQLDPQGARAEVSLAGALDADPLVAWRQGALWQARDLKLLLQANPQSEPLFKAGPLTLALRLEPGVTPRQAQVAPGRLEVLGAGLRWDRLIWQAPKDWDVQMELEPLSAAPVLNKLQPDFGWGGDLRIDGHLKSRRDPRGLTIDLSLSRTAGDLTVTDEVSTQRLGLTDLRLGLLAENGVWHLTQGIAGQNMGAVGGAITARTSDPHALPSSSSKLEGALEAKVDNLGNWGPWLPAGWRLGGSLYATLSLGGTLGAPEVRGQAGGQKLALRNALMGVDMNQGELALTMNGTQAQLEKFVAKGGNGQVSAEGQLHFGANPRAELVLKADTFALLQRVDRRVVASGTAQIKASAELLDLKGRFVVNEGLFDFSRGDAPQLDSDVQVVRQSAPPRAAEINGRPLRVKLDLDLELGRRLQLKGYGIDTRIRGVLHLAQDGQAKPTMEGEVSSEGGTFNAYGQKLVVERGIFTFNGPLDNPRLDVLAIRPGLENDDVRVGVSVTGTATNPRIKLYSDPDMSETNKLSWLVLGRSPDNLGRSDTALMQRAAMALISGDGESTSDKIIHNIGLDELSFSGEGDDARGTVVRLGKQLSRNVFVAYERGLNATTGNWQLIYKVAQRFTLRAQAGEDQQGLDVIWQWKWE